MSSEIIHFTDVAVDDELDLVRAELSYHLAYQNGAQLISTLSWKLKCLGFQQETPLYN